MPLAEAMNDADLLISGTGWGSDLCHRARCLARQAGIRSIAVIDHWVNYSSRFACAGEIVLPDEIWITDQYAEAIAKRTFPGIPVARLPNLYFENEVRQIVETSLTDGNLLYVLEPARAEWGRSCPGEFQALDFFVAHLDALGLESGTALRFRPHPSEDPAKYDEWLSAHRGIGARLDTAPRLSDSIANAKVVVGMQTFAMVIALAAGRRVVCTLPPWAPPCALPHDNLLHLKNLV